MTATPRLYSDDAKSKAAQEDAILCSVDKFGIDKDDIAMIIKKEYNHWIVFDVDNKVVGSLTDEEVTDE
jgi:predicted helicase